MSIQPSFFVLFVVSFGNVLILSFIPNVKGKYIFLQFCLNRNIFFKIIMLVFLVSESKCNTHSYNICKNIKKDYPKESFG